VEPRFLCSNLLHELKIAQGFGKFPQYFRFLTEKPSYQEIHAPGPRKSGRGSGNSKLENFPNYRNISTIQILNPWNPTGLENQAELNRFTLTPKQWIDAFISKNEDPA
jgi:hypothetical protein